MHKLSAAASCGVSAAKPHFRSKLRENDPLLVKTLKSDDITRKDPALLGAQAAYWLDLRDYHPVEVPSKLPQPMLFLQGERDYQVTLQDDFKGWQSGITGNPTSRPIQN